MTVHPAGRCGLRRCRKRLTDDNPSLFWCNAKHQAEWQAAQVDPGTVGTQLAQQLLAEAKSDEPPVTEEAYDRYLDRLAHVAQLRAANPAIVDPDTAAADRADANALAAHDRHRRAGWVHLTLAGITLGAGIVAGRLGHATATTICGLSTALPVVAALRHHLTARALKSGDRT
jgi:hypothetical protein